MRATLITHCNSDTTESLQHITARPLRTRTAGNGAAPPRSSGGPLDPRDDTEQVAAWARDWMVAALEVFSGRRPRAQLMNYSTPQVYMTVARRHLLLSAGCRRIDGADPTPVVMGLRACMVRAGVHEVAIVTRSGSDFTAAALRVERLRDRLRVTAIEI